MGPGALLKWIPKVEQRLSLPDEDGRMNEKEGATCMPDRDAARKAPCYSRAVQLHESGTSTERSSLTVSCRDTGFDLRCLIPKYAPREPTEARLNFRVESENF